MVPPAIKGVGEVPLSYMVQELTSCESLLHGTLSINLSSIQVAAVLYLECCKVQQPNITSYTRTQLQKNTLWTWSHLVPWSISWLFTVTSVVLALVSETRPQQLVWRLEVIDHWMICHRNPATYHCTDSSILCIACSSLISGTWAMHGN